MWEGPCHKIKTTRRIQEIVNSAVVVYQCFGGHFCFHHQGDNRIKDIWNVCEVLPEYTALHQRQTHIQKDGNY